MSSPDLPPEHVRSTFGLRGRELMPLGDGTGAWRVGEAVLSPVADHARAAWSASVRETLDVDGVRLARPVRSSDGRYVVSGWRADTFITGEPEARYDEVVSLSVRLHAATSSLSRPRFLAQQPAPPYSDADIFALADRAAWESVPFAGVRGLDAIVAAGPDGDRSSALVQQLASLRKPVDIPDQVVHGDLFSTVLFAGAAAPGIRDIVPYWRPAPWAAAVIVVDAISWGGADDGLIERWGVLPEWPQMLLRAMIFRLAVHALHDRATAGVLPGLERTADLVRLLV
nr:TIGR02569 family protein [Tomitella gaofuii]